MYNRNITAVTIALLSAQAKNFTSITAASRGGQEKTVTIETNVCRLMCGSTYLTHACTHSHTPTRLQATFQNIILWTVLQSFKHSAPY